MTTDINTFSFVAESLGNAFDLLQNLTEHHRVEHIRICDVSGFHVVNVTTNADFPCVFDAMDGIDDDLMGTSLRRLGHVEDMPE